MEATKILAKSLVNNRHGQNRQNQASAHLMGVQNQLRMVQANQTLATSMASSSKIMASMNKQMDPYKMQKNMQQYAMENEKVNISQDMMEIAFEIFAVKLTCVKVIRLTRASMTFSPFVG